MKRRLQGIFALCVDQSAGLHIGDIPIFLHVLVQFAILDQLQITLEFGISIFAEKLHIVFDSKGKHDVNFLDSTFLHGPGHQMDGALDG